jgi:hypothetical protein
MGKSKQKAAVLKAAKRARLAVLHAEQAKRRAADRAEQAAVWAWKRKRAEAA